ncbi:bifunctional folylpolyglutamate synthase/dihydrofolate synthase [Bittarella massiliensis (ex Durand et al. 2017)]|uniref:bifunctional folylpolyglutamate synthase/dihydrofolate synthase n=1 Tax=Bittarella massiliensis (ex Durand et al. 2017) TaxID=1720313 RepID=UPI001AA108BF|nr:folylpolyglutamate synthase/dihydrofolate synthase family protein [Bittarella massiliensis (ex Durand et al. 2017)]MBO1679384.1 bifunctional folylpolyglutamate synthase/dihydrofolate synthase [Bittarella massiliensis (ex Durand et al. 2017)]
MTYEQALAYIHGRRRGLPKPGLARMRELMRRLGDPQNRLRCIHVTGTNGKGSTTAMVAAVLQAAGYRVGRNVSPFVLTFRERFQIDGEMISPAALAALTGQVKAVCDAMEGEGLYASEFEIDTAIAFLWFAAEGVDLVCLEVGMGGDTDATNVIPAPLCCAITPISLDHTAALGPTTAAIAERKCGIVKGGTPVVCCAGQDGAALDVIRRQCARRGSPLFLPDPTALRVAKSGLSGSTFAYRGLPYALSLAGEYQLQNALTAIEVLRVLAAQGLAISQRAVRAGLAAVRFPARCERLGERPTLLLDGAHNPAGMAAFCQVVAAQDAPRKVAVTGLLRDKDAPGIGRSLAGAFDALYLVAPPSERAADPARLAAAFAAQGLPATPCASLEEALAAARAQLPPEGLLAVCGSLYLASKARPLLLAMGRGEEPPHR